MDVSRFTTFLELLLSWEEFPFQSISVGDLYKDTALAIFLVLGTLFEMYGVTGKLCLEPRVLLLFSGNCLTVSYVLVFILRSEMKKIIQKGVGLLTESTWKHAKLNSASIYSNFFPEMYGVIFICRVMLLICKHLENCQMFLWIFMSPQCFTAFSTGGHLPKNSSRKCTIYCSPFIFLLLKRFVIQLGNKISGLGGRMQGNPCSGQLR